MPNPNRVRSFVQCWTSARIIIEPTPGTRLGPYEVVAPLGAGGMGEVWRARDADRLARFKREAQVLASLNHPHIGAIYGFEDGDGVHALVLELVDGPTPADRIARGAVPLDEALAIARQIADALEAKALEHAGAARAEVTNSPTVTTPAMTQMGMILGTMSPAARRFTFGRSPWRRTASSGPFQTASRPAGEVNWTTLLKN